MKTLNYYITLAFIIFVSVVKAQTNISTLADANGNLTATITTLDPATEWILDMQIYVPTGKELHIEAGTVIKATTGSSQNYRPSIIVTRGAKIYAIGTAQAPIIMTTAEDNLDGTYPISTRDKWGGLIILGKAYNNLGISGDFSIGYQGEGSIAGLDTQDDRHQFGRDYWEADDQDLGNNTPGTLKPDGDFKNNDNSGVLKYISIRHGGGGFSANNAINGLTCGSVGSGTVLEHIEIVSNLDDGIQFYGGTVDLKYAIILFCTDDYIDWDLGYTGRCQFIFGVQLPSSENNTYGKIGRSGIDADGDDNDYYSADPNPEYFSNPVLYNCTFIGNLFDQGIEAKERTNGEISNSIFANFAVGVSLDGTRSIDAYNNFLNETLLFRNNTFVGNTELITAINTTIPPLVIAAFNDNGNIEDNVLIDYTMQMDADGDNSVSDAFNAVPAVGTAITNLDPPADDFFDAANYRGAFCPGDTPWTAGWTFLSKLESDNTLNGLGCPGDVDGDGDVDAADLNDVLFNFIIGGCIK